MDSTQILTQLMRLLQSNNFTSTQLHNVTKQLKANGPPLTASLTQVSQVLERLITLLSQFQEADKHYLLEEAARSIFRLTKLQPVAFCQLLQGQSDANTAVLRPIKAAIAHGMKWFGKKKTLQSLPGHCLLVLQKLATLAGAPRHVMQAVASEDFVDALLGYLADHRYPFDNDSWSILKLIRALAQHGFCNKLSDASLQAARQLLFNPDAALDVVLTLWYCPAINQQHANFFRQRIVSAADAATHQLRTGNSEKVAQVRDILYRTLFVVPEMTWKQPPDHVPSAVLGWVVHDVPAAALQHLDQVAAAINTLPASSESAHSKALFALSKALLRLVQGYSTYKTLAHYLISNGVFRIVGRAFDPPQSHLLASCDTATVRYALRLVRTMLAAVRNTAPATLSEAVAVQPMMLCLVHDLAGYKPFLATRAAACLMRLYAAYAPTAAVDPKLSASERELQASAAMLWQIVSCTPAVDAKLRISILRFLHLLVASAHNKALSATSTDANAAVALECLTQMSAQDGGHAALLNADTGSGAPKLNTGSSSIATELVVLTGRWLAKPCRGNPVSTLQRENLMLAAVGFLQALCQLAVQAKKRICALDQLLQVLHYILPHGCEAIRNSGMPLMSVVAAWLYEDAVSQSMQPSDIDAAASNIITMPNILSLISDQLTVQESAVAGNEGHGDMSAEDTGGQIVDGRHAHGQPHALDHNQPVTDVILDDSDSDEEDALDDDSAWFAQLAQRQPWQQYCFACQTVASLTALAANHVLGNETVVDLLNSLSHFATMSKIRDVAQCCFKFLSGLAAASVGTGQNSVSSVHAMLACRAICQVVLHICQIYISPCYTTLDLPAHVAQDVLQPETEQLLRAIHSLMQAAPGIQARSCRQAAEDALAAWERAMASRSRSTLPVLGPAAVAATADGVADDGTGLAILAGSTSGGSPASAPLAAAAAAAVTAVTAAGPAAAAAAISATAADPPHSANLIHAAATDAEAEGAKSYPTPTAPLAAVVTDVRLTATGGGNAAASTPTHAFAGNVSVGMTGVLTAMQPAPTVEGAAECHRSAAEFPPMQAPITASTQNHQELHVLPPNPYPADMPPAHLLQLKASPNHQLFQTPGDAVAQCPPQHQLTGHMSLLKRTQLELVAAQQLNTEKRDCINPPAKRMRLADIVAARSGKLPRTTQLPTDSPVPILPCSNPATRADFTAHDVHQLSSDDQHHLLTSSNAVIDKNANAATEQANNATVMDIENPDELLPTPPARVGDADGQHQRFASLEEQAGMLNTPVAVAHAETVVPLGLTQAVEPADVPVMEQLAASDVEQLGGQAAADMAAANPVLRNAAGTVACAVASSSMQDTTPCTGLVETAHMAETAPAAKQTVADAAASTAVPANPPAVPANPPASPANPPAVPANLAAVPANPAAVPANPPPVPANPPASPANPPAVPANPPPVPANPPPVPANPPAVPANRPAVLAIPPAVPTNPLAVPANPPASPANPPAVLTSTRAPLDLVQHVAFAPHPALAAANGPAAAVAQHMAPVTAPQHAAEMPDISDLPPHQQYKEAVRGMKRFLDRLGNAAQPFKAAVSRTLADIAAKGKEEDLERFLKLHYEHFRIEYDTGDVQCMIEALKSWLKSCNVACLGL